MDAWLAKTIRTVVVIAFLVGFPLWAILHGGMVEPPVEPPAAVPTQPAQLPAARITSISSEPPGQPAADAHEGEAERSQGTEVPFPSDRFTAIQRRLKELGASYLLLESLGEASGTYRFHCELDTPGSDRAGRLFEVTDPNPLAAMERVLAQVEGARAGRMQLGNLPGLRR